MKTAVLVILTIGTLALSGCFWAGLGVGALGGGAAVHAYDTKPNNCRNGGHNC